jgi:hypothetical protein
MTSQTNSRHQTTADVKYMRSLDDEKWKELHGGYRLPYDVPVALRSMQDGVDVWDELGVL